MESLKTILYFSIFKYPLKLEEIFSYYPVKDQQKIEIELRHLIEEKIVLKVGDFYLSGCDTACIEKRRKGNEMAVKALVKALERGHFISKFPFVEAVGVSGSLSKGYYDSTSDIDFFVITKPGRLWLARTFLMLYKKVFLGNSRKYFCINYFMSSANLELEEKNRYTATEVKTLIPIAGLIVFEKFYAKNRWISNIFGPFNPELKNVAEIKKPKLTTLLELLLDNRFGNVADDAFEKITLRFWKMKFSYMNRDDFKIALKTTKDISKHHPLNFQKNVIQSLNEKYEELSKQHNIVLQKEYV